MATLNSPGVSVTIIDQSQYASTQAGSVPFVLLATAANKLTPSNTVATGTTVANQGQLITITSQRDLVNYFGNPNFTLDESGNPVNGSEQNEYGLLAAYSALGVTNQMYVLRANVDLGQLTGTSVRPTGTPANGTYWLDLATTNYGIYVWTAANGFTLITPTIITNTAYLNTNSTIPLASFGSIGQYAVVATSSSNPVYYKGYNNTWNLVGSAGWQDVVPTIVGSVQNPTIAVNSLLNINGSNINLSSGSSVSSVATAINSAMSGRGVSASVNSAGQLLVYADNTANAHGTLGVLQITPGSAYGNVDAASVLGILQVPPATLTGNVYQYNIPTLSYTSYTNPPAWRYTDTTPRPDGSIWLKTSATGNGANWDIEEFNSTLGAWQPQADPLYITDNAAILGLDPTSGGAGLAAGTIYVQYDTLSSNTLTFKPYIKSISGILTLTGNTTSGSQNISAVNDAFIMSVSVPGSGTAANATITATGTSALSLVTNILAANLPNITAGINTSGQIYITHNAGGTIQFTETVNTPLVTAGIIPPTSAYANTTQVGYVRQLSSSVYLATPFAPLTYTYSSTAPYSNPADGTLWYYSNPLDVDIMINNGTTWVGYRTVTNDARGYNLANTDPNGPILSATQPTTTSTGAQIVAGQIWINTSITELNDFPVIYRYTGSTWALIDNADSVDANGILFADARWSGTGNVNPITDTLPTITSLTTNSYLDPDAPLAQEYARGTLLYNTRRSGYNVKQFQSQAFSSAQLATVTGTQAGTWVTHSGADPTTGVPYFGSKAQRSVVVTSLKSAIASSTSIREDQTAFNLIVCPGYPELIQDMVTLNDDRSDTAFIIGDSPLDLSSDPTTISNWAKNTALAVDNGENGLVTYSDYLAVYYPSCVTTNLDGNTVVAPPSHMMLRTYIKSDALAYPWFAPAGVRRGLVDNASAIGYIDNTNNNVFVSIGVAEGLRDVLYENEVNPITILPGVGILAYGQETRASEQSALDRVNVARLVCYLRTVLAQAALPYIFEPNDAITRAQVQSAFNSIFNSLVAQRGIYDYLVVCDTTNNTPSTIDQNELYVDIAIQPVKAVEFIYIPVILENTGSTLAIGAA